MAKTDMRRCTFTGRVGTAPEKKDINGTELVEFSLAVSQYKGPNRDPETAWYSVNLWGGRAKVAQFIEVGMQLTIAGEITQSSWKDKDTGKKVSRCHIDADSVVLPDRQKDGSTGGERARKASGRPPQQDNDELPW